MIVGYRPWGGTRYSSGQTVTAYKFTGQREEAGLGLYYYGARWYDPGLARFIQPDTIVPNPGDAQAFDRYAYALNNPLKYNDPSGHCVNSTTQREVGDPVPYDNDDCWRYANTIANMWDSTDYWSARFGTKEDFLKYVANTAALGPDFFHSQLNTFGNSNEGKAWRQRIPMVQRPELDFGDYTSITLAAPLNKRIGIGGYEIAFIMDDHWNFYYRSGPGIGSWGAAITRGDVLILQEGKYVDIDNLNLAADEESKLLQQRMPGVSSSISGGSLVFVAGVATSVDGETMTVESGFGLPPSPIAAFWAPESVTEPWFSWR